MSMTSGVWRRGRFWGGIALLVLALIVLALWQRIFIFIGSGEEGVLWSRFGGGTVLTRVYGEGTHLILPWNRMFLYDVRVQEIHDAITVLSSNGMEIGVKYSARYQLPRDTALARLHQDVGPDYANKFARPEVVSAIRRVVGNYTPDEIYATDEAQLLGEMAATLRGQLDDKRVRFDDVMLQELKLPEQILKAINSKIEQQHLALSYEFRIQREQSERERKTIEADGIAAFQRISGISMLKWRGIEATVELAKSPNTKIVIVGTDSQSLPLILNTDK